MISIERIASRRAAVAAAVIVLCLAGSSVSRAEEDTDDVLARRASDSIGPALAVGELSLLVSGKRGKERALVAAQALAATAAATELLKSTVRERRPDHGPRTSFPSGHASAAFAMATVIGDYQPKYKAPLYALAGTIAWSRVEVRAHYAHDVLAGALLGHFLADSVVHNHLRLGPRGLSLAVRW